MRISDWSSDVCSSDLGGAPVGGDWFALSGTTGAAGMRVLIADGDNIAAAAPWSASASAANQGGGTVAVRTNAAAATIPAPVPAAFIVRAGAGDTYEIIDAADARPEERRLGKECVSTLTFRLSAVY